MVRSSLIKNTNAVNTIQVDPYVGSGGMDPYHGGQPPHHGVQAPDQGQHIQFAIAGNQGLFNIYRFEIATQLLQAFEVDNVPAEFQASDFTSLAYTQFMSGPGSGGTYFAVLGASDGSMTAYDLNNNMFYDGGVKKWCISGEIGHARVNNQTTVVASSSGTIARFAVQLHGLFPTERNQVQFLRADGPIVSLAMDDLNNEGLAGTANGGLYYLNFNEKMIIRIVSKAYCVQKPVTSFRFNESNP